MWVVTQEPIVIQDMIIITPQLLYACVGRNTGTYSNTGYDYNNILINNTSAVVSLWESEHKNLKNTARFQEYIKKLATLLIIPESS